MTCCAIDSVLASLPEGISLFHVHDGSCFSCCTARLQAFWSHNSRAWSAGSHLTVVNRSGAMHSLNASARPPSLVLRVKRSWVKPSQFAVPPTAVVIACSINST
ncbi:hypothetical protein F441_13952 [Phytophthora nicotianae CJ01A1]|uniref:Uncharacterized protein n=3 Tax=Phytophthora nicotianae TaxID=4792 RepID=W2PXM0_PHYN3|nr:hypothetical protein PPTG_23529 [Phytophthora nicotianae INRA-310]ETK80760.1 hypothetical protein L915_13668 [Phytophthora nicotianae]ETP10418.1 hypothetical protein F441_13952 [Phytophthora nicotianae CJ01A1]ETL34175.1 hypothetical protein L916_13567 [Phytophthora nicotianae]ETM40691.1 hypothetical protein L914_13462 [Phytophthora nicotianae]ETN05009.1 hypothetical protein PPTG_23529 [Phytophthora nicotianae INRA-310]